MDDSPVQSGMCISIMGRPGGGGMPVAIVTYCIKEDGDENGKLNFDR